jgi:hypothetical protein
MKYTIQVIPAPAPVLSTRIELDVRYVVIRGDGLCRVFDTLYATSDFPSWAQLQTQKLEVHTILIPLDMFTAVRLGLVTFDELQLPEALRATINMIK